MRLSTKAMGGRTLPLSLLLAALLLVPLKANSTQQIFTASKIYGTTTEVDGVDGYCLVETPWPNKTDCPMLSGSRTQLAIDCGGEYGSKSAAKDTFKQFQLAMLLDKSIQIYVDDEYRINGWCVAYRATLRPTST